jgi:uncharacterized membrane protein YphA (DoxX/SURF4 family)
MSRRPLGFPVEFLKWSLGVVVGFEALRLFVHSFHSLLLAKSPSHAWFHPALAAAEIIGAILFLLPSTSRTGALVLLLVFLVAAVFHLLHAEWDIGFLIIYSAAVLVVRTSGRP